MLTRLVVFAGLLLVLSLNGDCFAADIDKDIPDSPEINVIWDRNDYDRVNVDNLNGDRLDLNFDANISLDLNNFDEDLVDDGNINLQDNRGYNDQLVGADENPFNAYDPPSANFESDIE